MPKEENLNNYDYAEGLLFDLEFYFKVQGRHFK